jgi:Zn-dependent protease with chaperone function
MRSGMLLAALTALFMAMGYMIGGPDGMLIALIIAIAMNLFRYWKSDSLVPSMHGAQEVNDRTAPEFVGLVRELATHPSTENRIAALEEIAASMGGGVGSPRLRRSGWRG